jgi:type IV pilus assembly protein PilN
MIRINLLPARALKKKEDIKRELLLLLVIIFAVVGGLYAFNIYLGNEVTSLENTKKEQEQQLKKYNETIKRIGNIQAQINDVKRRIDIINSLSHNRSAVIRSLDHVVMAIPQNRVYLRSINHTREMINIEGTAKHNDDVAEFMNSLKAKEDIKNVFLRGTNLRTLPNTQIEVVDFGLNCETTYKTVKAPPPKKK